MIDRSNSFVLLLAFVGLACVPDRFPIVAGEDRPDPAEAAVKADTANGPDVGLTRVIEKVRENERLYRQLETVVRRTTRLRDGDDAGPLALGALQTVHTVIQDDLVYCRVTALSKASGGSAPVRNSVSAYDGEKSRSVEFGNSANIHLGRYESGNFYPPHCWALYGMYVNFPLSVLLEGTEAMRRHPKVHHRREAHGFIGDFHRVEPTLDGEEVIAGLRCQKIKLRWWYDAQNPPVTYTLWLAPERNYLCIRWHSLSDLGSREAVGQASQVDEMRELAPGVWLPARVTYTQYDYESLRQVEPVVSRHETFAVEKVFLNPGRPVEFFRNVEIPDDIPVYTIENRRLAGRTFSDVAAPESSAARLVEIVAELKTNERLYENMAVELDRKYRHFRFSPEGRPTRSRRAGAGFGGGKYHAATRSLEKSVLQGGKGWFFEAKETDFDDGTTSRQETTVVGDGDSIQIVERDLDPEPYKGGPKLKTRVQQGRPGHDRAHRPHLLLERDIDVTHSLSELFASKWEGEFHQGNVDVDALGEDECDGNPCDVVRVVDHLKDGKGRYSVHLFWLAKSRNFLPIRAEYYALTLDQHLPLRLATATELREIARGVWFPGKASAVAFERMGADDLSTGRLVILFRNDYRIDKVTLNPNVPPERFAKINVRDDE